MVTNEKLRQESIRIRKPKQFLYNLKKSNYTKFRLIKFLGKEDFKLGASLYNEYYAKKCDELLRMELDFSSRAKFIEFISGKYPTTDMYEFLHSIEWNEWDSSWKRLQRIREYIGRINAKKNSERIS